MNVFNSLRINKKILYVVIGGVIITEISYRIFKKFYPKKCRKHQVLFFSATNNTYWRSHDRELQYLCMYLFTSEEIAQTVLDAHLRGIKIRIITDFEMSHSSGSKMEVFQSHGIQVRFKKATNCLMHHKFCLFDANTENGVLMTGSLNLTMQAVAGNWDNAVFTTQSDLIQQFQQEFNRIWSSLD